jgi:hypothetical protein
MKTPSIVDTGASEYVVILQRHQIKMHTFGEHSVSIGRLRPEEMTSMERTRINETIEVGCGADGQASSADGSADDGYVYFVEAHPDDVGSTSFVWITKAEAIELDKQLREIDEKW